MLKIRREELRDIRILKVSRRGLIMKKVSRFILFFLVLICALAPVMGCSNAHTASSNTGKPVIAAANEVSTKKDYWPGENWRESTPEEQEMDSAKLLGMLKYIQSTDSEIHSIVLIRNGYKVLDANFFPYKSNIKHVVNSCTKSISSTLFGIAFEEGLIKSVDTKVVDYFKDRNIKNNDEKKNELTLKHLLTMTAGFDWSEMVPTILTIHGYKCVTVKIQYNLF
jgi:hypothetical protein